MTIVPLTQGKVAMIDDADAPEILQFKWHAKYDKGPRIWYAARNVRRADNPKRGTIRMHRQLLGGVERVDHKNGDGLDNQRHNLRAADRAQNMANSRKRAEKSIAVTSRFKGVGRHSTSPGWNVEITYHRKRHYIGYFEDEVEAAKAYDAAAERFFGEFARLNFPVKDIQPMEELSQEPIS